ncbi:hypothetical protein SCUCBS95973_007314 [Sporothrix curviconia]|uniref:Uncharacterized protein n=1 Tax=Sporothrix curviconia TaxID=1260050 RepID=A0ABP0CDK7_9PEZI
MALAGREEDAGLPGYEPPQTEALPSYEDAPGAVPPAETQSEKHPVLGNGEPSSSSSSPYRITTSLLDPSPLYGTDVAGRLTHPSLPDAAEMLPPTELVFNGKDIFSASAPDVLLYGTDLGTSARSRIRLVQRFDRRRIVSDGSAVCSTAVRTTARELYMLGHNSAWGGPRLRNRLKRSNVELPRWYMHKQHKSVAPLGDWGFKDWHAGHWEALPVHILPDTIRYASKEPKEPIFSAREDKGVCTWSDASNRPVAKSYEWSRLVVTAPLRRDHRDLLPYRVHTSLLDIGRPADNDAHDADVVRHTFVADPAEILPPAVLVLDGQAIYAESSSPDAVLYHVDRGLTTLGPATKEVRLQRSDRRTLADGAVRVRERDLYTLSHLHDQVLPSLVLGARDRPRFFLRAESSRTAPLGNWGVRECGSSSISSIGADDWELIHYAVVDDAHARFTDKKHPLFRCRYSKTGVCTWTQAADKKEVASMNETAGAGSTTTPRLFITAPLRREHRDLLVAMWCCYVWEQALRRHVPVPLPRGKNPYRISRVFN